MDFLSLKEVMYKTVIFIFLAVIALIIGKLLFKKIREVDKEKEN